MSTPKIPRNIKKGAEGLLFLRHNAPVYRLERILSRFTGDDGHIYFEVEWDDGHITTESRNSLIKDAKAAVQQFEKKQGGTRKQRRSHRKSRKNRRVYH